MKVIYTRECVLVRHWFKLYRLVGTDLLPLIIEKGEK